MSTVPVRASPGRILAELWVSCAVIETVAGCNDWNVMEDFVPDRREGVYKVAAY